MSFSAGSIPTLTATNPKLLSEQLLKGNFQGKDTITVRVHEEEGEKKLAFDPTSGAAPELVGAGAEAGKS